MAKIPVALQLYTVRDDCAKDFIGTLKQVAKIGYKGVEFAGLHNMPAAEVAKVIKELGMKAAGVHTGPDALTKNLDATIAEAKALGSPFLVCAWLPEELRKTADDWRAIAKRLSDAGKACKKQGIQLCYHNHSFEFGRFGSEYGLDLFFGTADPDAVKSELDVYWVKHGGVDPIAQMTKYGARVALVHLKDMAAGPDRAFAEVGEGTLDIAAIVAQAEKIGSKWLIVEQDTCARPALESARLSFDNLKKMDKA